MLPCVKESETMRRWLFCIGSITFEIEGTYEEAWKLAELYDIAIFGPLFHPTTGS